MTTFGADAVRWAPELVLAAASLGGAAALLRLARTAAAALAFCSLTMLGIDAALGAAEYGGVGGRAVVAAHSTLTALFKSAGLAAALAAVALSPPRLSDRARGTAGLVTGAGALLASFALPLAPVLLVAHVASVAARPGARACTAALAAAAALALVVASQLLVPGADGRLAALHLGLAGWAVAFSAYVHASRFDRRASSDSPAVA